MAYVQTYILKGNVCSNKVSQAVSASLCMYTEGGAPSAFPPSSHKKQRQWIYTTGELQAKVFS